MRVLIVEDEPRLARNIGRMLKEKASYAVDISPDGEDGLHMALTNPYDLIILDLMLPRLNGLADDHGQGGQRQECPDPHRPPLRLRRIGHVSGPFSAGEAARRSR